MTQNDLLSRRGFLKSASAAGAANWLKLGSATLAAVASAANSAHAAGDPFTILSPEEAADFAAIAARIIPTTDTPGATEAGVVHFFDQAFANEMKDSLAFARDGLDELNKALPKRFTMLFEPEQDAALKNIEGQPFFRLALSMTIFGFFAMSKYGGNKDHVGWDLVGFKGHHGAWHYPFGHYDAEVHSGESDGD